MKLIYIGNNLKNLLDLAVTESGEFINSKKKIYNFLINKKNLNGSYAFALILKNDQIFLTRDKIGARKLFYFYDKKKSILYVSNNFISLIKNCKTKKIYSVPRGGYLIIDKEKKIREEHKVFKLNTKFKIDNIKITLISFFKFLKFKIKKKPIICLSGGLDSALITFFASQEFDNVDVVSAVLEDKQFCYKKNLKSHDFIHAKKIGAEFQVNFNSIYIKQKKIFKDLSKILKASQDWRGYNIHCAVLNYYIGKYISENFNPKKYIVLTGDFMNEAFADYTSEFVNGNEYYKQPNFSQKVRQRFFLNGLDSSDREVGIFSSFGLSCIQPYSFVLEQYKLLTNKDLSEDNIKYKINGSLLPKSILNKINKQKVRAQVGDSSGGILGHFINNRMTDKKLEKIFSEEFNLNQKFMNDFIQIGVYKT
jgi:asparagine synthetase B (glutamine-hydrolysing)